MKFLILIALLGCPMYARDAGRFVRRANLIKEIRLAWNMEIGQSSPISTSVILSCTYADDSTAFVAKRNGKLLIAQFDASQADPVAWLMVDFKGDFKATSLNVAGVACVALDVSDKNSTTRTLFSLHDGSIRLAAKYETQHSFELDGGVVVRTRTLKFQKVDDGWLHVATTRQTLEKKVIAGSAETVKHTAKWRAGLLEFKLKAESRTSVSALLQLSREMEQKRLSETAMYYAKRATARADLLKLEPRDPRRLKANTSLMRLNARREARVLIENSK
ncbi:MAG: hypothetical protein ACYTDT_01320 [Planctomycetota bacterium]